MLARTANSFAPPIARPALCAYTAPVSEAPEPPSRSRLARGLAFGIVAAVLVYGALAFAADLDDLKRALGQLRWESFALACALSCVNYLLRFGRWQRYLGALQIPIALRRSVGVFGAGFVLTLSPGKVAELYKVSLLRAHADTPPEVSTGVALVMAERLTDLIGMVLLLGFGLFAFPAAWPIAAASLAIGVAGVVVLSSARFREWLVRRLRGGRTERLAELAEGVFAKLGLLLRPRWLLEGTLLAAVAWAAQAGALLVIVGALGAGSMSPAESAFTYAAATLGGVATLLPGGLGATELGLTALTVRFAGTSAQIAGLVAVLVRAATLWLAVALGALAWVSLRARRR